MKSKRREKPILQVLLIASLAINTTLSFVVLAKRNRAAEATERKESVATPAVITLEGAAVEAKLTTAASPASQPDGAANAKRAQTPQAMAPKLAPQRVEKVPRDKDEVVFLPSPVLYRLIRDAILVTRGNGARILIPQGTLVRVAGISLDDKALVVSCKGNPDGLIARSSLEAIPVDQATPGSSGSFQRATATAPIRVADGSPRFRLSGGPYGGSIGLGGAQIYVGQNGQVSGTLSR